MNGTLPEFRKVLEDLSDDLCNPDYEKILVGPDECDEYECMVYLWYVELRGDTLVDAMKAFDKRMTELAGILHHATEVLRKEASQLDKSYQALKNIETVADELRAGGQVPQVTYGSEIHDDEDVANADTCA